MTQSENNDVISTAACELPQCQVNITSFHLDVWQEEPVHMEKRKNTSVNSIHAVLRKNTNNLSNSA